MTALPTNVVEPLPAGHQLEGYVVRRVLAAGGFSIVYLADGPGGRPIALKEYLPCALAVRTGASPEPLVWEENVATFRHGLKCFVDEGVALSKIRHPNVVRVLDFFRANGTAYLATQFVQGQSLQALVAQAPRAPDEGWLRATFAQLLNGLREVHLHRFLHLDIKPANIYLRASGAPVLIDFGAARQALAAGRSLRPQTYTPGFAAPEQVAGDATLGPWSDIYSIGATLYACLGGEAPPDAAERQAQDRLEPAARRWSGRCSADFLETIDACLRLDPLARPQSVFALQKALAPRPAVAAPAALFRQIKGALLKLAPG